MQFDLFISYAWTSNLHREWVRLLASHLHAIGFAVGIDEKVNYGESLSGFMRKIKESKHVLMIADENYAFRADNMPDSGVAIECRVLHDFIDSKPSDWLAPLLIRNPTGILPKWISKRKLKYFDFRSNPENSDFPGSEQIIDLWRWLSDLPVDKQFAEDPAVIRERMARTERIDTLRDPGKWAFPELERTGIKFEYSYAPNKSVTLGYGQYEFKFMVSECGADSVYVYSDNIKAVGILPFGTTTNTDAKTLSSYVLPNRTVTPVVGQSVVLLNQEGFLCIVKIIHVENESSESEYTPASITFDYRILLE